VRFGYHDFSKHEWPAVELVRIDNQYNNFPNSFNDVWSAQLSRGRIASFIEFNKPELAIEIAQGKGERLLALVEMYGVKESDRAAAISALKSNQVAIFIHKSSDDIQDEMDKTLQPFVS
jgi:hypothetical protein